MFWAGDIYLGAISREMEFKAMALHNNSLESMCRENQFLGLILGNPIFTGCYRRKQQRGVRMPSEVAEN